MRRIGFLILLVAGVAQAQTFQTPSVQQPQIVRPQTSTQGNPVTFPTNPTTNVPSTGPALPGPGLNIIHTSPTQPIVPPSTETWGPVGVAVSPAQQTPILQPGSVAQAQTMLGTLGFYGGPVTGQLNGGTRAAIRQFQASYSLPVTGELDLQTAQAMGLGNVSANAQLQAQTAIATGTVTTAPIVPRQRLTPTSILTAQEQLVALGLLSTTATTGVLDQQTQAALLSFQESMGVSPTGQLDVTTQELLSNQAAVSQQGGIPTVVFRTDIPTVQP